MLVSLPGGKIRKDVAMKELQENPVEIKPTTAERNLIVYGTHVRVKSVFGYIPLEKAIENLALRRMADKKTA